MSGNDTEVSQLASILRQNGDKVLNALSKLSLNATLLQKLNSEFESLIENGVDSETSFQVITSNHGSSQLLKDLHFLHDFIQKTVGLKITNGANLILLKSKIDISKFKNVKYLEFKKVPIKEIIGLKHVQSQLESIVCVRCLSKLEELLASCGGDNSSGFVWSELREAVFSFNNIKVVDTSVAFAPWLQVLDLSHNQISDIKAIEYLPNLKYVNLSFNCLETIPTFNKSARKKIELLVMKNNYVEDLSGLNGLCHLTELDLSNNWVSSSDSFSPLLSMSALQCLSLSGNPISCHKNYRRSVAGYLHISASFSDFYLDNIKLSKKEKAIVGIKLCDGKSPTSEISRHSLKSQLSSGDNNGNATTSTTRRSGKVRLVVIPNLDDGTYEEAPSETNSLDFMSSSTEYLITKKRIENTRSTYGIDNWLVQGSSVVQDILGLPPIQASTSTPYDELCLNAALNSGKKVVTTTAVIETRPEPQVESLETNNADSFVTANESNTTSNYFTAETSTEKVDSQTDIVKNNKVEEAEVSREVSPDIEEIPSEELELDENEKLYVVSKEVKTYNNETKQEEIFLTITDTELIEREPTKGKIITKWSLSSLESCVKLKSNQLQFVFDTVRRDKRERTYSLEEPEAIMLYKQIAEILESRTLSDMNQVVYKCEKCSSQFSVEKKSRKSDQNLRCPFCKSKFILELHEPPLPSNVDENKTNGVKNGKNSNVKVSHNRSSSTGGFFQSLSNTEEDKILKCPSQSSIDADHLTPHPLDKTKSTVSLDELNELPTIQNSNVKRSDSDIEILSNPSQSSIEVIDGPGRAHSGSTPRRKRSSEERQYITPTSIVTATNLIQGNNPTGLTESSSSGSVTDSICTAYESSSVVAPIVNKPENVKVLEEESENGVEDPTSANKNFGPILEEALKKARTMEMTKDKQLDPVNYSYSDFTSIDHRIKLYLYTHVFDDPTEEFSFGLRALVVPSNSEKPFPSCVIASNKKLYFLKVINNEEGDDARNFLQKSDSLCFNLNAVDCVTTLTWYQGFCVKIQSANNKWKQFLILLKNSTRTKNFLNFLTTEAHNLKSTKIIEETLERPYLAVQHLLLSCGSLEDTSIQYFSLFNSCSISHSLGTKDITSGGILINYTELLLFIGSLNWLFDGDAQPSNPEHSQKFKNLVQVYIKESRIFLQFFDGIQEKEVWDVVMEGEEVIEGLIKSLKDSWEKIFCVPLQISSF